MDRDMNAAARKYTNKVESLDF